jgi:hypothetical protein
VDATLSSPIVLEPTRPMAEVTLGRAEPGAPEDPRFAPPTLDDARFQPSRMQARSLDLDLDLAVERAAVRASRPPVEDEAPPLSLCPRHGEELSQGRCPVCEAEARPIPGRLFAGALRQRPQVRYLAGLILGLVVGYVFSAPYARRQERQVAQLRAEANADRYRPLDEARLQAALKDRAAEDLASSAMLRTVALWLAIGGVVFGGWIRAT